MGIFIYILGFPLYFVQGFVKILLQKTTLKITFNKYQQSEVFPEKKSAAS